MKQESRLSGWQLQQLKSVCKQASVLANEKSSLHEHQSFTTKQLEKYDYSCKNNLNISYTGR
jgi:hypothetical protein